MLKKNWIAANEIDNWIEKYEREEEEEEENEISIWHQKAILVDQPHNLKYSANIKTLRNSWTHVMIEVLCYKHLLLLCLFNKLTEFSLDKRVLLIELDCGFSIYIVL